MQACCAQNLSGVLLYGSVYLVLCGLTTTVAQQQPEATDATKNTFYLYTFALINLCCNISLEAEVT